MSIKISVRAKECIAWLGHSNESLRAYLLVSTAQKSGLLKIEYYLLARSVEHSLKGILVRVGYDGRDLKITYGHNLSLLVDTCVTELSLLRNNNATQINISDFDIRIIKKISTYYNNKELEYFKAGIKVFPIQDDLKNAAEHLVASLGAEIRNIDF